MNQPNVSPAHAFSLADALIDDLEPLLGLQVAFAPKPIFHRGPQPVQWHASSSLKNAIANRKRIVKDRIVGEVPHGKVVDLADRAGAALAGSVYSVHGKSPRKHGFTVNEGVAELDVWKTSASAQELRLRFCCTSPRRIIIVSATVLDATAKSARVAAADSQEED